MTDIAILDTKFKEKAKLNTEVNLTAREINVPVVHQVVKAILAGRRQGTACTKTKALVSGGGIKPFKQKGTGSARQGSSRSPLMPGGGNAFGPTPRDYTQKINKTVMLKAIQSILADKLIAKKLHVVEKLNFSGKTKEAYTMLEGFFPALVVVNNDNENALKAIRNLEKAEVLKVKNFNVYEAVKYETLIVEKDALEILLKRLG